MAISSFSTKLCNYIISKQQSDLYTVCEKFSDKISIPEDNMFFIQNEILDKILDNIEKCNKNSMSISNLYDGINKFEKLQLKNLDLINKLSHHAYHCKIIGVEFFDEKKFMNVLNSELDKISSKYNLNGDDDYNKLYLFLSSLQLMLQSSDDVLNTLSNQYVLFKEHSDNSLSNNDEFISIYGERYYKIDILKNIINTYNELNVDNVKKIKTNKVVR